MRYRKKSLAVEFLKDKLRHSIKNTEVVLVVHISNQIFWRYIYNNQGYLLSLDGKFSLQTDISRNYKTINGDEYFCVGKKVFCYKKLWLRAQSFDFMVQQMLKIDKTEIYQATLTEIQKNKVKQGQIRIYAMYRRSDRQVANFVYCVDVNNEHFAIKSIFLDPTYPRFNKKDYFLERLQELEDEVEFEGKTYYVFTEKGQLCFSELTPYHLTEGFTNIRNRIH